MYEMIQYTLLGLTHKWSRQRCWHHLLSLGVGSPSPVTQFPKPIVKQILWAIQGSGETCRLSCNQHAISLGSDFGALEALLVRNSTLCTKYSDDQSRAHKPSKYLGKTCWCFCLFCIFGVGGFLFICFMELDNGVLESHLLGKHPATVLPTHGASIPDRKL